MKLKLLTTAAIVASLICAPAFAQQNAGTAPDSAGANSASTSGANANQNLINGGSSANNGGVTVGPDTSSSNSGASANQQQSLVNGGSSANNGGVSVGDTTSTSHSASGAISGSLSTSQGGTSNADSHATGGSATTGASSATTGASTATTGASTATTGASTSAANNAATNQGNAQNLTVTNVSPDSVRTVPTVYAPALTTTLTETCMGSTTAGGSWLGGGISLGTTWEDKSCKRRLNARELAQTLGDREAARAVLCGDPDIADAYERLGRPCPKSVNYHAEIAAQYMPQLPTPPQPPTPVVVNVAPATPPAYSRPPVTMAPIPNPPEHGERD
jgi:hypothetical protein